VKSNLLNKNSQPGLFFIIGRPRSGTTLLRSILDAHSKIIVPPEYPVLLKILKNKPQFSYLSNRQRENFFKNVTSIVQPEYISYDLLGVDKDVFFSRLCALNENISFNEAFKLFVSHCSSSVIDEKPLLVGDKNPVYVFLMKKLIKQFDDASFVILIRDPRDQFASLKKFEFEATNPILQALRWKKLISNYERIKKKYPERVFLVSYEKVVQQPEKCISEICQFLGVEYNDDLLNFSKLMLLQSQDNNVSLFTKYHDSLTKPLSINKIDFWKESLTCREIAKMQYVTAQKMKMYGYEMSEESNNENFYFSKMFWSAYQALFQGMLNFLLCIPPKSRRRLLGFIYALSKFYHRWVCFSSSKKKEIKN